jgi:hypothetical protein
MSVRNLLPIALLLVTGSAGCTGSPTQGGGVVTITQTTTTTTTTAIPQLTAGAVATSPTGVGVASATLFQFSATPAGGVPPYTLAWNFGDGEAGAGATATHGYKNTGNFTATAIVNDSKGTSAQSSANVSVRSVTGRWTANFSGVALKPESIDIVQDQTAVTATINETADGFASGTGSVTNPRSLQISATFAAALPAPYAVTFVGTLNDTLQTWSGTVTGYAGCPCGFTATRSIVP